jgi:type II secretory pathway pseudopilin PulG
VDPKVIVLVVVAILVIGAIAVVIAQRRKAVLRQRFGSEYERTVKEQGSERRAQTLLEQRAKRVDKFNIRPLSAAERDQYAERWRHVQSRFVDDPRGAVVDADETVSSLMGALGYPMADFEQRAADLSVDHAPVVDNYRAAHEIALLHRKGQASTEDLRQAMIYYRSLFEELLNGRKSDEVREVA